MEIRLPQSRAAVGRRDVASDVMPGKLTGPQLQQLLSLYLRDPQQHTPTFLAQRFQLNVDDVAQLLKWVCLPKTFKYEQQQQTSNKF
jgi:hypothetical protein